jgi:hypothetical protein
MYQKVSKEFTANQYMLMSPQANVLVQMAM